MSIVTLLLLQLGLVLVVAMLLGALAERFRLPAIAGQLLGGVVLGPSVFGALTPGLYSALFTPHNTLATTVRTQFLDVGLLLFIFFVGLEIDISLLRERARIIVPLSVLSIAVPFGLGFASVIVLPGVYGTGKALPLLMAVALSISALPVIAAIISDLNLMHTHVGQLILSCAVINDLYGWLAFAAVAAAFTGEGKGGVPLWGVVLIVLGGFALAISVGRRMGVFAGTWVEHHVRRANLALGLVLACALLASGIMEGVGAHAFFGALLTGLALSAGHQQYLRPVENLVRAFYGPAYFGAVGLSVNVIHSFDLPLVLVVFVVACAGKGIGAAAGARLGGTNWRNALAIAAGLNARGAIEILLAVVALSVGLIDSKIFVAIVVMALGTSILAGFFLQAILRLPKGGKHTKHKHPVLQPVTSSQDS